jgi:hypothetical protein
MTEGENKSGTRKLVVIILISLGAVALLIAGVVVLISMGLAQVRRRSHRVKTLSVIREVELACINFSQEYARYPWAKQNEVTPQSTIDPKRVYSELKGNGPQVNTTIDYVGKLPARFLKDGGVVDHWGRPLQFRVNPQTLEPVVWSYGLDGRDDTNDGESPDAAKKPKTYYWFGKGDFGDDIVFGAKLK